MGLAAFTSNQFNHTNKGIEMAKATRADRALSGKELDRMITARSEVESKNSVPKSFEGIFRRVFLEEEGEANQPHIAGNRD